MRSLAIILVQYDRQKYPEALRRLIQKANEFEETETTLVVVDNLLSGNWYHEVAPNFFHLGGDNSAWEFSAFDRGCRFLAERQHKADVYAFVTDAFTAYGDAFLELINDRTLDYTIEFDSCSGWVDSIFQTFQAFDYRYIQHLRTSFLLTTPRILKQLGPLATPIDASALFSGDPSAPFRKDAPLSQNLQDFFLTWLTGAPSSVELERFWHSRFDLCPETLPLFEAKTIAILREQLLSARLLSQGTACYDFRLLAKLSERGMASDQISIENRRRWQWLHWKDTSVDAEPRFFIEQFDIPEVITHGDQARANFRGWLVTMPQVSESYIQLAPDRRLSISCDLPRSDGLPGFDTSLDLQHVPPGAYDVEWIIPTSEPQHHHIGRLRVAPCHRFLLNRLFLPEKSIGSRVPVSLQGQFQSTYALRRVRPQWNGEAVSFKIWTVEKPRLANGIFVYEIKSHDSFRTTFGREQHLFSLIFETVDGATYTWNRNTTLAAGDSHAFQISQRQIGPHNAASCLTSVQLQGLVFTSYPDARILLTHEGRTVLDEPLSWVDEAPSGDDRLALGRFNCHRQLAELPAGTWGFEIQLSEGRDQAPKALVAWQDTIGLLEPVIHVDQVEVDLLHDKRQQHLLRLVGWVENDFLVDYLLLEIDGAQVTVAGLSQLRSDAAYEANQTLIRRQGFHIEHPLELAPGPHEIRLVTGQTDGNRGTWHHSIRLEELIIDNFRLESKDIELLTAKGSSHFWSTLELTGCVESQLRNVTAKLYIDGQEVDRQPVSNGQSFCLRYVPQESGNALARVVFEAGRTILYDTQTATVQLQSLTPPRLLHDVLKRLFEHFAIQDPLLLEDMEATCRGLMERNIEDLSAFMSRLRQLNTVIQRARSQSTDSLVEPQDDRNKPKLPNRPLRVLFACWEVPSLRHGGGVCMLNLLKGLAKRHQVTVVHPFSLEECGWIEDVRPFVTKIISVPREHHSVAFRHDRGIPEHYFANYVPSLRRAVEAELATGTYDLVNYEYTTMFSHISSSPTPRVLSVLELGFRAKLTAFFQENNHLDESLDQLQQFLESLHFYTDALPNACRHLITLTKEDGEALAQVQGPDTRVFVNTIGVDEERFERPLNLAAPTAVPTLVFLGNYRHPPNVHAATFFAERIMPEVVRRHPTARFLMIGSHVPAELRKAAQHPNIEITGFVDDFRPFLWNATAFVAPIFKGAGMRVKILEAMACSCPVISTELGMNGLGGEPSRHFLRAETADQFIDATCHLISHPDSASEIGAAGRQLIESRHSWRKKAEERETVWAHLLESQNRRALPNEAGIDQLAGPKAAAPKRRQLDPKTPRVGKRA